jgi:signal peptidase I
MATPPTSTFVVVIWLLIGVGAVCVQLWSAGAAFLAARRNRDMMLTRYNRLPIYVLLVLLMIGAGEITRGKWSPYMLWEAFDIPAGSMIPTLLVGDHLVSWRFAWRDRPPQRGELAIFKLPRDKRIDYVKRIIGLPGDTIQMRRGRLVLNGAEVQRASTEDYVNDRGKKAKQYIETLPNGRAYKILEVRGDNGSLDNTQIYQVPPGYVFVLGDNRDNSADSRVTQEMSPSWTGLVPLENLYAKPTLIYWSRDKSRIGTKVK